MNKFIFLFVLFFSIPTWAVQETSLISSDGLNAANRPEWHRSSGKDQPAQNKILFVKFDADSGCNQVFLLDTDTLVQARLTTDCHVTGLTRSGDKLNPRWGPFVPFTSSIVINNNGFESPANAEVKAVTTAGTRTLTNIEGWTFIYSREEGVHDDLVECKEGCALYGRMIGTTLDSSSEAFNISVNINPIEWRISNPTETEKDVNPDVIWSDPLQTQIAFTRRDSSLSEDATGQRHSLLFYQRLFPFVGGSDRPITMLFTKTCGYPAREVDHARWINSSLVLFEVALPFGDQNGPRYSNIGVANLNSNTSSICQTPKVDIVSAPNGQTTYLAPDQVQRYLPEPDPSIAKGSIPILYYRQATPDGNFELALIRAHFENNGNYFGSTFSSSSWRDLLFTKDTVSRRHPVWLPASSSLLTWPAKQNAEMSGEISNGSPWIAYERQDDAGVWQIYGAQLSIMLTKVELPPNFSSDIIEPIPTVSFTESEWTRCVGDKVWPAFTNVQPDDPALISDVAHFTLEDASSSLTLLTALPEPTTLECPSTDPEVPEIIDPVPNPTPGACTAAGGEIADLPTQFDVNDVLRAKDGIYTDADGNPLIGTPAPNGNIIWTGKCVTREGGFKMTGGCSLNTSSRQTATFWMVGATILILLTASGSLKSRFWSR